MSAQIGSGGSRWGDFSFIRWASLNHLLPPLPGGSSPPAEGQSPGGAIIPGLHASVWLMSELSANFLTFAHNHSPSSINSGSEAGMNLDVSARAGLNPA